MALKCNICNGQKRNADIKLYECLCGTKFYAGKRNRIDRFCSNECANKYGTIKKIAGRIKQPEHEILNAWKAGLLWCGGLNKGGHWAHQSRFWTSKRSATGFESYCKDCYSRYKRKIESRWHRTRSNSWMKKLIGEIESTGSINRSLKKIEVSWPTYTRRRKADKDFEEKIHAAKKRYFLKFGIQVKDFGSWHKPSYLIREINQESKAFFESNKNLVETWFKIGAFKWCGKKIDDSLLDVINTATLMFLYNRFTGVQNFERLAKFYGRCAAFQILNAKRKNK